MTPNAVTGSNAGLFFAAAKRRCPNGTSSMLRAYSLHTGGRTMLVERGMQVPSVEVVSDAYAIAANYLRRSSAIPDTVQPNDRLVDIIVQLFQRGEFNKLKLANKAISVFEAEHAA
jgi:hypothetical protein